MQNNITFYPFAGTWLGAEWYGDILPWDDDIDIALTKENFDKLNEILKNKKTNFHLVTFEDEGHENLIAKLYFNKGVLIEGKSSLRSVGNKGIFIDLTILFPVSKNRIKRIFLDIKIKFFRISLLSHRQSLGRFKRIIFKTITLFISGKQVAKSINKIWRNDKKYEDFAELNNIKNKNITLNKNLK
ncbi:hypothetical protein C4B24_05120, partial [Mycoplasma marinum]